MTEPSDALEDARRQLDMSFADLWFQYFSLGGMSTQLEIEAILYGALVPTSHNRDLLAVALNERFAEQGGDHPLPYSGDDGPA